MSRLGFIFLLILLTLPLIVALALLRLPYVTIPFDFPRF
uniref:Uncharacterized protein n=1 Tax=Anguilla anguilla TaxID=7936 RepID=A0A0E9TJ57_ANGAN